MNKGPPSLLERQQLPGQREAQCQDYSWHGAYDAQPRKPVSPTPSPENSAQGNPTPHSETPPVRRATVTPAQWSKGGLDGMVSPFRRGRIQLPVRAISCIPSASRPSIVR